MVVNKCVRLNEYVHDLRIMVTRYPPNSDFRRIVAAAGREGSGRRFVQFTSSVDDVEHLRLLLDVVILWARQHALQVWLDDSVKVWLD